jgi:hypothetical protein
MGDAVLGLVASQMGGAAPRWVVVRNVSDPQIKVLPSQNGCCMIEQINYAPTDH